MSLYCKLGLHEWEANQCLRCGKVNLNPEPTKSATIGNQIWMAENLMVNRFRNGDAIPEAKTIEDFRIAGERKLPAWIRTNFGGKHVREYNWFAVNDERGLAPPGWKVPSVTDFEILFKAVDLQALIVAKQGGTNASGFSSLSFANYWTSTRRWFNPPTAYCFWLRGSKDAILKTTEEQSSGCLVRCIRE